MSGTHLSHSLSSAHGGLVVSPRVETHTALPYDLPLSWPLFWPRLAGGEFRPLPTQVSLHQVLAPAWTSVPIPCTASGARGGPHWPADRAV